MTDNKLTEIAELAEAEAKKGANDPLASMLRTVARKCRAQAQQEDANDD